MFPPNPKLMKNSYSLKRRWAILAAVILWFAVGTQLILLLQHRTANVGETLIRFMSYFTILTNILAASYFTVIAFTNAGNRWYRFFARPGTLTAITVYILVVGLVYQVVLRKLWEPSGLQLLADELLHSVNPLLVLIFWVLYEKVDQVHWNQVLFWMIYPLLYLAFILARGEISGFYPYPFVNVGELGLPAVLINSFFLCLLFLFLAAGFVLAGKAITRHFR